MLQQLCICIGAIYLLHLVFKILRRFPLVERNLHKRYGGGWAVVTGGTDGIGLGYCEELAKRKFNICIISRNKQKLQTTAKQLEQSYPGVATKIVVADFSKSTQSGFFASLLKELEGLDVSVLVNNVGTMVDVGPYISNPYHEIQKELNLNLFPMALLTRGLLPKMLARTSRSAIITLSSFSIYADLRGSANYCSTKLYNDIFSRSIEYECSHKIDLLSVRPALVTTPLTRSTSSWLHASKNQCAGGSLKHLGYNSSTNGFWWHELQSLPLQIFPHSLINFVLGRVQDDMGKKYQQIDQKHNTN